MYRLRCILGVYINLPYIYSHARLELPYTTHVFAVVFVWRLSSANELLSWFCGGALGLVLFQIVTINPTPLPPPPPGARIAQCLERRTCDRKVASSNPCTSDGKNFFSRVMFLCWLLFRYPFHPRVTAVARKRPRSVCQKCRGQVTAKYACTLRMWLCMKWHGAWLYGAQRTRRDGSSFMWHQPCQRCEYTTSVDIQKRAIKSWSLM